MRPLATAIAITGLAAAGVLFVTLRPQPDALTVPSAASSLEDQVAAALQQAAGDEKKEETREAPPPSPAPPRIRPVQPDIIAAPPIDAQALERVAPREPDTASRARSPSDGPPQRTLLHRPLVKEAGTVEAMGHVVRLAGIVPVGVDEQCRGSGVAWPCGNHARTAFRNWLRGRAISCTVPPAPDGQIVVSDCSVGEQNPAEWLVEQGWARAEAGGPYLRLEEAARAGRRGVFGSPPAHDNTLTITVPESPQTAAPSGG